MMLIHIQGRKESRVLCICISTHYAHDYFENYLCMYINSLVNNSQPPTYYRNLNLGKKMLYEIDCNY